MLTITRIHNSISAAAAMRRQDAALNPPLVPHSML